VHEEINSKYKYQSSSFVSTTTNSQYLHGRLHSEKPPATISQKTHQARNHKVEHDWVHDKPREKARIGAGFGALQTAKKKHALEHSLVHDKP